MVSQKIDQCYEKLLFSISETNHMNAYDQVGNQTISSIYIQCQFHKHWPV